MLFTAQDPMEDLLNLARAKNPALTHPAAAFSVSNITASASGRNTIVTLKANIEYGIKGQLTVMLDRTRLEELYNKFPSGNRKPLFKMFGLPGATITLSSIIDQVNQMLGTSFLISGAVQDLVDTQFVMPNKDASITITVKASPKSVRLVPDTTLEIEIVGSGTVLTGALVNRSLNPIVNASGQIPYGGIAVNPASAKMHPGMKLKFMDFSSLMAGKSWSSITSDTLNTAAGKRDEWLNVQFRDAVNAKLNAAGIPPMITNSLGQTPNTATGGSWYWDNYMFKRTANFVGNPLVNSDDFEFFLIMPKATLKQTESATAYATDYYLHYN